jgi:hypothetical protein
MFCALFAGTSRATPAAASASGAAAPAAAAASAAAAAPAAAAAALPGSPLPDGGIADADGRSALCSSQDSSAKVYNFFISTR